jgi:predicted murein hydrolase (TIGR00659 family)
MIDADFTSLWVYLSTTPLLGLTTTLVAYQVGYWCYARSGLNPWLNPVLLSVCLLAGSLMMLEVPYATYFNGAQFVHFLLGPATVALAVPLYQQWPKLRALATPMLAALAVGGIVAALSATGLAWMLGASKTTLLSLLPKSVTAAIAMGISEKIGGLPSLTAILVVTTGILGAVMAKSVFNWAGIQSHAVRGFAVGVSAHGIGTARAFQVSEEMGAFAGLAMGLNGLITALVFPLILWILHAWL